MTGTSKFLVFLFLGFILVVVLWFSFGNMIPGFGPDDVFGGLDKDRFKIEAQMVHKTALEEYQKLFTDKTVIYSDCNENYKHLVINTVGEEVIHYYVEIYTSAKIKKLYVSNLKYKLECENENGINIQDLDKENCEITRIKEELDKIDYLKLCK